MYKLINYLFGNKCNCTQCCGQAKCSCQSKCSCGQSTCNCGVYKVTEIVNQLKDGTEEKMDLPIEQRLTFINQQLVGHLMIFPDVNFPHPFPSIQGKEVALTIDQSNQSWFYPAMSQPTFHFHSDGIEMWIENPHSGEERIHAKKVFLKKI